MSFGTEHTCIRKPDWVEIRLWGSETPSPAWVVDFSDHYMDDLDIEEINYCPWCGVKLLINSQELIPHLKEVLGVKSSPPIYTP